MRSVTSPAVIADILKRVGPSRTGILAEILMESLSISPEAARQRLSRARTPIERFPRGLLPRNEDFLYLTHQRGSERYWNNLLRDLRDRRSVYACSIDALAARGGIVPVREFAVVSGAPVALQKHISVAQAEKTLLLLGVIQEKKLGGLGDCFVANADALVQPLPEATIKARRLAEGVILDGLSEWVRVHGIGSYYKVNIRGDIKSRKVGAFHWDLTAPSYLRPVRRASPRNGFVVADVFAATTLDVPHIQYFIRKVRIHEKSSNGGALLPILVAGEFTRHAITAGHSAGLMLATPRSLFGRTVADALSDLLQLLHNVTTTVAGNGETLYALLGKLSEIEGRSGNMRGILFELIVANIAKHKFGGQIDLNVTHTHRGTGQQAEFDVVCMSHSEAIQFIECRGKQPGGVVSLAEVTSWLRKLPSMRDYVASHQHLRDRAQAYALWTTGTFAADALDKLRAEKARRTLRPISWSDGTAVRELAAKMKLRSIRLALDQHYLKHPLASRNT